MIQIRILVVDDHPVVRAGLRSVIDSQPDMCVVADAADGAMAVCKTLELHPDVVLMDLRLPGVGGVEAIQRIRGACPQTRILVLTTYDGDEDINQALKAGAASYIIKGMPFEILLRAIRLVHAGRSFLPQIIAHILDEHISDELSNQERRVLSLMAEGQSNRQIAEQLCIKERTVKFHVGNILALLGVDDRTQAVIAAIRRGYVHLGLRGDIDVESYRQ